MNDIKQAVSEQFSKVAANYKTSEVHAQGVDLQRLAQLVQVHDRPVVLDVGCGAGHAAAAAAPYSQQVIALDLTPPMLTQVESLAAERGLTNISTRLGDVEALPFEDGTFDVVVSRYSAHHWPNPVVALREIRRVLKAGSGRFLLSDVIAPEPPTLDTFLQAIELLRDTSHVRDHTIPQWLAMFTQAGFSAEVSLTWDIPLNFQSWVERMATPTPQVQIIQTLFQKAGQETRAAFQIGKNDDFVIPGTLFIGRQ